MEIRSDHVAFLTSGVALLVATRDASLRPACARAMGATVAPERDLLTIYVPTATSERTLANLRDNGRIAVNFTRLTDLRAVQIKGACVGVRPSTAADERAQRLYVEAFDAAFEQIGVPRAVSGRMVFWPSVAIDVRPESIFEQTPGPTAGRPLAAAAP